MLVVQQPNLDVKSLVDTSVCAGRWCGGDSIPVDPEAAGEGIRNVALHTLSEGGR